ncbi:protein of unknown function [Streptomyces murinus]
MGVRGPCQRLTRLSSHNGLFSHFAEIAVRHSHNRAQNFREGMYGRPEIDQRITRPAVTDQFWKRPTRARGLRTE